VVLVPQLDSPLKIKHVRKVNSQTAFKESNFDTPDDPSHVEWSKTIIMRPDSLGINATTNQKLSRNKYQSSDFTHLMDNFPKMVENRTTPNS